MRSASRRRNFTAEDVDSITVLYGRGRSVEYIATLFGMSRERMAVRMKEMGIDLRTPKWISPEKRAAISAAIREGAGISEAAKDFGVTYLTAKRIEKSLNE